MTKVTIPSRTAPATHAPESLQLPTLGMPSLESLDETNKSLSIRDVFVGKNTSTKQAPKSFLTAATPRASGHGIHNFEEEGEDEQDEKDENDRYPQIQQRPRRTRTMTDPPGKHDNMRNPSRSKQKGRSDPETAASIHRRRKRFIEEHHRNVIVGESSDLPSKQRYHSLDGTAETVSICSQQSSWVPTRRIDKDPENVPVHYYTKESPMSRQSMEIRDKALPQRPWRPDRTHSKKRNNLAEADDMEFSTTNEWVPSEFYRKRKQQPRAMQVFPSGDPHVMSSYPANDNRQYQEYLQLQQQRRRRQQLQHQIQLEQEIEAQKRLNRQMQQEKSSWRPQQLPQQPPSIIHTITTATTPSTPTPENDTSLNHTITTKGTLQENDLSKESEIDSSDVVVNSVVSSHGSDTMAESFKPRNRDPTDSITDLSESFKNQFLSKKMFADESKAPTKASEESDTIQESLISLWKAKEHKEPEENSTILDSKKGRQEMWNQQQQPISDRKIINKEYTFDSTNDDGFDESLLSSSLTVLDTTGIPVVIPHVIIRKSGTSDITFEVDGNRQAIDSTLTFSDEDVTWQGSTIHNSIISTEEAAIAAAAAMAREMKNYNGSSKDSRTPDTGGGAPSLIGSGTSGFTGKSLTINGLTESGVSGLTSSGILAGKDVFGNNASAQISPLAAEINARARIKMEDIPSEVSSYVEDTLSANRSGKQDSEGDDRSSWHHRSNITTTSTMVSTKKVANKRKKGKGGKFKPRRSSTSTLPSIGSIIPEESWDYGDVLDEDDEDNEDEDSYYEIEINDTDESSKTSDSDDDFELADLDNKLSSILENASQEFTSQELSKTNSRDKTNSQEFSIASGRDLESGDLESGDDKEDDKIGDENDDDDKDTSASDRNRNSTMFETCACLDIRCFDRNRDGSRGRFNPTMGVYVVIFLFLILISVWTGIAIVWLRVRQPEKIELP